MLKHRRFCCWRAVRAQHGACARLEQQRLRTAGSIHHCRVVLLRRSRGVTLELFQVTLARYYMWIQEVDVHAAR